MPVRYRVRVYTVAQAKLVLVMFMGVCSQKFAGEERAVDNEVHEVSVCASDTVRNVYTVLDPVGIVYVHQG